MRIEFHHLLRLAIIILLLICNLFVSVSVFAQSSQWQELNPATSPPARSFHSITYVNGKILLFGGLNGVLNDTWEWERLERNWKKQVPANDPPPARYSHGAAAKGDKLYIFFGMNVNGVVLSDVWSFNPSTGEWKVEHQTGTEMPNARYEFTCTTLTDGSIAIFGGQTAEGPADNFLWTYETDTDKWNKRASVTVVPRRGHSAALNDGNLYIFGGETPEGFRNNMLKYSPANNTWESINVSGEVPPARARPASAYWGNSMWIFGGGSQSGETLSDAWRFDFRTYTWTEMDPGI